MPFGAAIAAATTIYAADQENKASKRAARSQRDQNEAERQFILEQTNRARDDVNRLYELQAQNAMTGGQSALDILRGSLPQQAAFFNQGQNNAMAAILGGQLGGFAQPDFSFIPQQLPQYKFAQQLAPSGSQPTGPSQVPSAILTNAGRNAFFNRFGRGR